MISEHSEPLSPDIMDRSLSGETNKKYQEYKERYLDPEELPVENLISLLESGEPRNLHEIENFIQPVPPHRDKVLVGSLQLPAHRDKVIEAELILPGVDKALLVIYKPESGRGKGTKQTELKLPTRTSPYHMKEAATWLVGSKLDLEHLLVPAIARSLHEGPGSIRPYIWGEPLGALPPETQETLLTNSEALLEDIAILHYVTQNVDSLADNLIVQDDTTTLKTIDHSLTFFDEAYALQWNLRGPRLSVAYEVTEEGEYLKKKPLPDRILTKIENFIANEARTREQLRGTLNPDEINGIFKRVGRLKALKIFL